jgi:hypothetical protein
MRLVAFRVALPICLVATPIHSIEKKNYDYM